MFLFLAKLLKKHHFGDFVVDFGGTFCYAITVTDMVCKDICYKPCLPGCSGGQGELKKTMDLLSSAHAIATIHGTVRLVVYR